MVAAVQPDSGREDNNRRGTHSGLDMDSPSALSSTVAPLVPSAASPVPSNDLNDCPLCSKHLTTSSLLWQHFNVQHLSRGDVPVIDFFSAHDRLICASCGWAYHKCFISSGCGRSVLGGKCCIGSLTVPVVHSPHPSSSTVTSPISPSTDLMPTVPHLPATFSQASVNTPQPTSSCKVEDITTIGINAASTLHLPASCLISEDQIITATLREFLKNPIPHSVRSLFLRSSLLS